MTRMDDRRHRIQAHTVSQVQEAIRETVYGEDNVGIVTDLFIGNMTYEQVGEKYHMSHNGLYTRVRNVTSPMENYLNRIN